MGELLGLKYLRMGVNFCLKTCRWLIISTEKTYTLVFITIILPGNGWFPCSSKRKLFQTNQFWVMFYCTRSENGCVLVYQWASFSNVDRSTFQKCGRTSRYKGSRSDPRVLTFYLHPVRKSEARVSLRGTASNHYQTHGSSNQTTNYPLFSNTNYCQCQTNADLGAKDALCTLDQNNKLTFKF